MSDTKTILKGSFWIYAATAISLVVGFLSTIILSRFLDRDGWGIFSTILSVSLFLSVFMDLGFNYTITYYTSTLSTKGKYRKLKEYLVKLLKYRFLLILTVAALIFVFSDCLSDFFHMTNGGNYFRISSLFFIILNTFSTFDAILNGLKRFKANALFVLFNYVFKLIFAAILIYIGLGVVGAIVGYTLAYLFATLLSILILQKIIFGAKATDTGASEPNESISSLFIFGSMIGLAQMAQTISVWTDSVMIGAMVGATFVGVYRIAITMSSTLGSAIGVVNRVVFPVLVGIEAKKEESSSDFNNVLKYGSFFAIPAVFGLAVFSKEIISVFFGQQYIDAAPILLVLSYLCFDGFIIGALVSYFSAKKEVKTIGVASALCAITNVILNLILIPILGMMGAAIASVITRIFNLIILLFEGKRKLGLQIDFNNFQKPLLGSIVMILVLLLIRQFIVVENMFVLFLLVGICLLVYVIFEALIGFNILVFGKRAISLLLEK
jgi:O-antigen/teichoic acid export membrane protein